MDKVVPNAIWRLGPQNELHPFRYNYDLEFGPYTLEEGDLYYPNVYRVGIPFNTLVYTLMHERDAIGIYNYNNDSLRLIYKDHMEILLDESHHTSYQKPTEKYAKYFSDILQGYGEQTPVGFKRTELITLGANVVPWRLTFSFDTMKFSDAYPGIENAELDPPSWLFLEMNKRNADYAWIDNKTKEPHFGMDPNYADRINYYSNGFKGNICLDRELYGGSR